MNTLLLAFPVVNLGADYVEKPAFTKLKDVCLWLFTQTRFSNETVM